MAHKTVRSTSFHSPTIRGAYFYLHDKRTKDGSGAPIPEEIQKYEFVGLIPKLDQDPAKCGNYKIFSAPAMSLIPQVADWNGQWPAGGNWPIKNGDEKAAKYPWMAGNWVINFSSHFPPKVAILQNGQIVEIPARRVGMEDAYKSGDYCVVSTYAFSYDNKSRGLKFDIEGVLFVGAGEAIGMAQRSASQIFEGVNATLPPGVAPSVAPSQPSPVPGTAPLPPQPQQYAPPSPPTAPVAPMPPQAAPVPAGPGMAPLPPFPGAPH